MSHKQLSFPSKEQRKSQINMLNFMEKERRDSKEFHFPDDNLLHKRRPSAGDHSATQSEDDESVGFEVKTNCEELLPYRAHKLNFLAQASAKLHLPMFI